MQMINHILHEVEGKLNMKKYIQFSSHDSQIANVLDFLQYKDWYYIPYASHLEMELSMDSLCLE